MGTAEPQDLSKAGTESEWPVICEAQCRNATGCAYFQITTDPKTAQCDMFSASCEIQSPRTTSLA